MCTFVYICDVFYTNVLGLYAGKMCAQTAHTLAAVSWSNVDLRVGMYVYVTIHFIYLYGFDCHRRDLCACMRKSMCVCVCVCWKLSMSGITCSVCVCVYILWLSLPHSRSYLPKIIKTYIGHTTRRILQRKIIAKNTVHSLSGIWRNVPKNMHMSCHVNGKSYTQPHRNTFGIRINGFLLLVHAGYIYISGMCVVLISCIHNHLALVGVGWC